MTRCLRCRANVVNLALIPVVKQHFAKGSQTSVAYELSTYGATLTFLKGNFQNVVTSEYMPEQPRGAIVGDVRNEDVQDLTFADRTFDLITSNSVFEHVPDDIKGFAECFRVLKDNGSLIFSVPLYDTANTIRTAEIRNGELIFHREPEYHDSRIGGPKSALTFWRHSLNDICERVTAGGFSDVKLLDVTIAPSQGPASKVVYAVKR